MDFVLRSIPVLLRTGSIGWASTSPICFKFHDSPTLDDPQVSEGCEPVKSRCVPKKSEFLTGGTREVGYQNLSLLPSAALPTEGLPFRLLNKLPFDAPPDGRSDGDGSLSLTGDGSVFGAGGNGSGLLIFEAPSRANDGQCWTWDEGMGSVCID